MTTYNSYEVAKIANPEYAIFEYQRNFGTDKEILDLFGIQSREVKECNPADHCITVDKFLYDGHEFVEGDIYLNSDGRTLGVVNIPEYNNKRSTIDCDLYILRAAALETKEPKPLLQTGEEFEHTKTLNFIFDRLVNVYGENPNYDYMHKLKNAITMVENRESPCNKTAPYKEPKRTKESYEKLNFECAWHAVKAFEDGEKLYTKRSSEDFVLIDNAPDVLRYLYDLHERIETPIEWWEDASEFVKPIGHSEIVNGQLLVEAAMTRDQWCDFARILLEQGE